MCGAGDGSVLADPAMGMGMGGLGVELGVEFGAWDESPALESPPDRQDGLCDGGIEARHMDLVNTANDSDQVILYTLVLPEEEEGAEEDVDQYGRSWGGGERKKESPGLADEAGSGVSPLGVCRKEASSDPRVVETYQFYDGDMVQIAQVRKDGWMRLKDGRGWIQQKMKLSKDNDEEAVRSAGVWNLVDSEWPHYQLEVQASRIKGSHLREEPEEEADSIHRFNNLDIIEVSSQAGNWLCVSDGSGWVQASHPEGKMKWVLLETEEWEVVPESPYFDKLAHMFRRRQAK